MKKNKLDRVDLILAKRKLYAEYCDIAPDLVQDAYTQLMKALGEDKDIKALFDKAFREEDR